MQHRDQGGGVRKKGKVKKEHFQYLMWESLFLSFLNFLNVVSQDPIFFINYVYFLYCFKETVSVILSNLNAQLP